MFRSRARRGMPPAAAPVHPPVEFSGIAAEDLTAGYFPWEFQTDTGVWVRLHDMDFLGFEHRVRPSSLTLRFGYADPAWTPQEAAAIPVATFCLERVTVQRWEDDDAPVETPELITHAGFDPLNGVFELVTSATHLVVAARRVVVSMGVADGRPAPPADTG